MMSECRGQLAAAVHAPPQPPVLLTDKEGRQLPPDEALDEAVPEYRAPGRKTLQEIQQLDPEDESLAKYKRALLGPLRPIMGMHGPGPGGEGRRRGGGILVTSGFSSDPSLPNVQVTRLTLLSEQAPGPITMDLTGTAPWGLWGRLSAITGCHSLAALSLTGELAALKNQVFVLKEGVDYRVKITFKVRVAVVGDTCQHEVSPRRGP